MDIYVYSDESGVFDKKNNDFFVFGGLIFIGKSEMEICSRNYSKIEKILRKKKNVNNKFEIKATNISIKEKYGLFRSLNKYRKFGVVIRQEKVLDNIFNSKKDKQRYLDFAYKLSIKRAFERMINNKEINPAEIENIYFFVDEHTTATNGKYELKEALEQEFKRGTYNSEYSIHYPPIFPKMKQVNLQYCNSANKLLIRAADIIANRIYFLATRNLQEDIKKIQNSNIIYLP